MKQQRTKFNKILKKKNTFISQIIATGKHNVKYGQGNGFPYPLLKIEVEV